MKKSASFSKLLLLSALLLGCNEVKHSGKKVGEPVVTEVKQTPLPADSTQTQPVKGNAAMADSTTPRPARDTIRKNNPVRRIEHKAPNQEKIDSIKQAKTKAKGGG